MSADNQAKALTSLLSRGIRHLDISLSDTQLDQLIELVLLLNKWNRAYNLTAIRAPEDMVIKHLLDSLAVQAFVGDTEVIDVGTGGGFPGLPLAIVRPSANFVLLDASSKKIRFVQRVIDALGISNASAIHCRVEDYVERTFDVVICRAFASLNNIVELTSHLLTPTGSILAMKGQSMTDSDDDVIPDGWRAEEEQVVVPLLTGSRHVVTMRRAASTDPMSKQD
ncbi:MAG: 16S rRNA (guanine(527)-N(7))-methyltransferase RsmG [Pseudomonadota bacterium]